MSAFDSTIRVGEASVQGIESEDGKVYEAHLILGVVTLIPVGPGQAAPLPLGVLRVPMNYETVKGMRDQFDDLLEVIQKPSDIQVASNLSEADRIKKLTEGLR